MSTNANDFQEIDLDAGLDDWPDLPTFEAVVPGSYMIRFDEDLAQKKMGDHNGVEVKMTIVEVNEVAPEFQEEIPVAGKVIQTAFMLDNAVGVGQLKEVLKVLLPAIGATKPSQIIATENKPNPGMSIKGLVAMVVVTRRVDKKDADKKYNGIKTIVVA